MGAIPRLLFSPECEAEIKQRWPSRCPACGCVAYLGLNEYRCVFEPCKYGSKKEADAYAKLLEEDAAKHGPQQYLKAPETGAELKAMLDLDWEDEDTEPGIALAPLLGICRICNHSLARCTCPC